MSNEKIYGDPSYYELVSNISLNKSMYYPIITNDCYLLTYKQTNLIDPNVTPLCKYHYAGIQKFLISDDEYCVYDIDRRLLDERSRLLHESGKITDYSHIQSWLGKCPTNYKIDNVKKHNATVMSALCKIEDGLEEFYKICVYKCKCA